MIPGGNTERQPGLPDPHPVLGHTYHFLNNTQGFYDRCIVSDGDVLEAEVGGNTFHYVTSPELVNEVLYEREEQFEKSEWLKGNMEDLWGDGLIIRSGERQRKQRERLQPMFELSRIQSYTETFARETRSVVDQWERGETYRIDREMQRISLRVLWNFLFGSTIETERERKIVEAYRDITAKFDFGSISALLPTWIPVSTNRKYARATDRLESEVDAIFRKRNAEWRESSEDPTDMVGRLLDALDEGPTDLTEEVVKDEIGTFLFEHRTLANHLACTLYLLAEHPEKRERLQEELARELGGESPGFADPRDLTYLNAVTRESLRLFPTVHTMFREPTGRVGLGGQRLDPDSILALSPYIVHRDAELYDDPGEFRPSRWNDRSVEDLPGCAYFPFGGGRYHCIGMRLSELGAVSIISTILQEYDLSPAGGGLDALKFAVHLEPENGLSVGLS